MILRVVFLIGAASMAAWSADLYVTPDGNDANAGSEAAPFATLARAHDAARSLKQAGPVTIWVRGGTYFLSESLSLSADDSGTQNNPVVYRAAPNETPRLVGGRQLPAEGFHEVTDAGVLARIPQEAQEAVRYVDLKSLGIADCGDFPDSFENAPLVAELFCDGERMTLARWPNEGWATVESIIESGPAPWRKHESDKPSAFAYTDDRPSRWASAPAVYLCGYWCFDWAVSTLKVNVDAGKKTVTFALPHVYGLGSGNPAPRRYYATNLLDELDRPGEYYIDREHGVLYFWPPRPLGTSSVVLSTLKTPLIAMDGVSNVTFQGFTMEECAGTAVVMKDARNVVLAACDIHNTGQDAVVVEGGEKVHVIACDIYDTGTAGIRVQGGDRKTLTPCGHEIMNNHLYRISARQRTHAYAIHMGGVGVMIAHNLIHDTPHQAIGLAGNDHIIEFNEIHHSGLESDDCGAFYMGRNPSERGTILRYNFWHDTGSSFAAGSSAIYFDDGAGGQTVFGNVFLRASGGGQGAVFSHGGHDNVVNNNIFVDCKRAFWQAPWDDKGWKQYLEAELWQRDLLQEVDITKPPYLTKYPELAGFMTPDGRPRLNHATRNVIVNCAEGIEPRIDAHDNFVTSDNPGFVDANAMNFALKDDSVLFEKLPGFEKIPFGQMGLQQDQFRTKAR